MKNIRQLLLIGLGALALAACGKTVEPGNGGVKINNFGGGVQQQALNPGWHGFLPGVSRIEQYPTIQRTYTYDGKDAIAFTDRTGLGMSADVQLVLSAQQARLPHIYTKYRLTFDQLLAGPIRNDIRTAIAAETELVAVDQLLAGGRQEVIRRAFARVQKKWAADGVTITQLDWIGAIHFPDVITAAIQARTQADQQVNAAKAKVAVAEAQAAEKVAIAQGDADAYRLRGDALRANPQVLEQQEISKWTGLCPRRGGTCVLGNGANTLIKAD